MVASPALLFCPAGTWATLPSRSTFPVTDLLPGRVAALLLPPLLPVPVSAGAFEQPALIRATMARRPAAVVLYSCFLPACSDCVDTSSMPSVLVTAASLDRA